MLQIGRRLYFDVQTGNILVDTGEHSGFVIPTTVEHDIISYRVLSEINRETFDYIELPYGAYTQDFIECNGYRVNPDTHTIEFSYPDPNLPPEEQNPVYRKPLSEEIDELKVLVADLASIVLEV